jgi:hypothetical protein
MYVLHADERVCAGESTQRIAQAVRQSTGIAGKRFNDLMSEPEPSRYLRQEGTRTVPADADHRWPGALSCLNRTKSDI